MSLAHPTKILQSIVISNVETAFKKTETDNPGIMLVTRNGAADFFEATEYVF